MGAHHHHHGQHRHTVPYGRAFGIGIGLNLAFVVIEAVAGLIADSVALLADAGHNLSDVLGLMVAFAAYKLSQRPPSPRFTYGLRGSSILAALFNALFLLIACGGIAWEALRRFAAPPAVEANIVMIVAGVGIAINLGTALLFRQGGMRDINIRGAYLHMAADAAVSAGVVAAALLTLSTGWRWIDPAVSLAIVAVIVAGTWGLFKEALALSLQAVPPGIDPAAVADHLAALPGVRRVHHLHIWAMSTTETALTAHLVMESGPPPGFLADVAHKLDHRFGIHHTTIQVDDRAGNPFETHGC